jgi:type III restriction enzyme
MLLKDYQKRTLEAVRDYLETLAELRTKAGKLRAVDPDLDFDFAAKAWEKAMPERSYVARRNGLKQPLPAFCLKIPTGGGKTLLATKIIDLVNTHYRQRQAGLVLWIVPSTQIYNQTFAALKDRDHPYRQTLDNASAGRTVILEKTSGFAPADVAENLCVLLLMLPSANRLTKEALRMFRDSGGFDRFFPADDDRTGHAELLKRLPNLDTFEQEAGFWGKQIKTSLGNTLKLRQPLIILDEGHKAYSDNARATLEGFNPCLLVELSATPPKNANVLVEISGQELNCEEMIKLDLHIQNRGSTNWRDTLLAAIEHRDRLEEEAKRHEANTNIYIRPISLIQVERTGKEQRGAGKIHAEDVKDYLVQTRGIPVEQIAIKTSQTDDLKEVDDDGGLLARDCTIRYIITKQALQEGWDCPFAYVLVILTNSGSKNALTQLVGRILRQPYAKKTHVPALDESYVFCFQRGSQDLLKEVRKGFAAEGLGDLEGRIILGDGDVTPSGELKEIAAREKFAKAARNLVLPAFFIHDRDEWRLVHYEADILSRVPWEKIDVSPLYELPLTPAGGKDVELRANLEERVLGDSPEEIAQPLPRKSGDELDYAFVASHLLDVMPNPWRGHELAARVFDKLLKRYPRELVVDNFVFVIEELRKQLECERDRLAETIFRDLLKCDILRFMLWAEDLGLQGQPIKNRLPAKLVVPKNEKKANRLDGSQFELDLFNFVPVDDLNSFEQQVATYLDGQQMLFFWHRNRVKRDYSVQGWKRGRIFADFIFTTPAKGSPKEFDRVFVVETKGLHLKHNADTDYKRAVFDVCNDGAKSRGWSEFVPAMRSKVMKFDVVDEEEWQRRLNTLLLP